MKPAKYFVLPKDGERSRVETDSPDRAREYATNYARAEGRTYTVMERNDYGVACVYVAHAPGTAGTPLPRPQNR